jgi:NCAIR mutase (PurE)-related protein
MDFEYLRGILEQVKEGSSSVASALKQLRKLPYEDIGFAKIDHHRTLRTGVPEVIYCEGKSVSQIVGIAERMAQSHANILGTRISKEVFEAVAERFKDCEYYRQAKMAVFKPRPVKKKVGSPWYARARRISPLRRRPP